MATFNYTKSKLLYTLKDMCETNKKTFCVFDIYTSGQLYKELSYLKCCVGNMFFNNSKEAKSFLSLETKGGIDNADALSKASKKARELYKADFSLFISSFNSDINAVKIFAQSDLRTYCINIKLDDEESPIESISHKAIYELTKLVYNEIHQSIPTKERKLIF